MPRTVLITGASGFVGRHLLPALRAAFPDARLVPTSRRAGVTVDGIPAAELDIGRTDCIRPILEAHRPDIILHLAGLASPAEARAAPEEAMRANREQTIGFADIVRTFFPETVFVFVSSAMVYGRPADAGTPIDESRPLRPIGIYGKAKAEADRAIGRMAETGLRAIRLRPFNHTGPGQPRGYVIPDYAARIARMESEGGGAIEARSLDDVRDFLDVRDVCRAYVETVRRAPDLPPGLALNLASGVPRRLGDVLDRMLELAGVKAPIALRPGAESEIPYLWGDASKAREILGWKPEIPFDQTLRDTLAWWRTAPSPSHR